MFAAYIRIAHVSCSPSQVLGEFFTTFEYKRTPLRTQGFLRSNGDKGKYS